MIVQFTDSAAGSFVYINPRLTLRPDPSDPTKVTLVKLEDGESIRVRGEHTDVADRLTRVA